MSVTDKKVHWAAIFAREPVQYQNAAVPINQAAVKVASFKPHQGLTFQYALKGWVVENVQVWCTAVAATASVDVQISGVSILNPVITPVAATIVQGTLVAFASRQGKTTDSLDVVLTTNGTGTITNLSVTITIRPFPLDNEAA